MSSTLHELGLKYGTDKVTHGFCNTYDKKFTALRNTAKHVLEIGVFFGASILMWRDYFTQATIHGLDTFVGLQGNGSHFPNADKFYRSWVEKEINPERIQLYKYDQSSEPDLVAFVAEMKAKGLVFDVIIDDGSHLMRDQQLSLKHLLPLVAPNGYYVIEDIHSSIQNYADIQPDRSNTTLNMIYQYMATGELRSIYTDMSTVTPYIQAVDLETNSPSSMTCLLRVKETI